jgi:putative two-component system response regulator
MKHVLIVDDIEENRYLLQSLLQGNGYRVTAACDGIEALSAGRRDPPDVVVSDALMPNMDGFSLCRAWMQDAVLRTIPFVFYSATYTSAEDEKLALTLGAVRYLIKPQEPESFMNELNTVLEEWAARRSPGPASPLEEGAFRSLHDAALSRKLLDKISQLETANRSLQESEEQARGYLAQLQTALMSTVKVVITMGEMRDPYTAGHQRRVAHIAVAIGAELGFDANRQEGLHVAGCLHDIGKIAIPAEILAKPRALSAVEFQLVKAHARASYDVLKDLEFPWPVAEVALQHHERLDGSGYPQGLKGEAILFEARIVAVADVVEAMASHRPYRAAAGIDNALAEIEAGRSSVYDSAVADACLRLFREKGYTLPE